MTQKKKLKIKKAFAWGTSESLCSEGSLLMWPKRAGSQNQWHNPQSTLHSTGQTLQKVYNKELPTPESGISVYSKPPGEEEPRAGEEQQKS